MIEASRLRFFKRGLITAVFKDFRKLPDWRELLTNCSTSIFRQSKTFLNKLVGKASSQRVDGLSCVTASSRVFESMTLLIYRFLIVFEFICMSGIKDISNKTQKWSDNHRNIRNTETLCDNQVQGVPLTMSSPFLVLR